MIAPLPTVAVLLICSIMTLPVFLTPVIILMVPVLIVAIRIVRAMLALIARYIFPVVPVVVDKIDRLAAGVVFVAMFAPVFGITRRHVQIDGLRVGVAAFNHFGLAIDHLRLRVPSDIDAAIKPGLADSDRDIRCQGGCGAGTEQRCKHETNFHLEFRCRPFKQSVDGVKVWMSQERDARLRWLLGFVFDRVVDVVAGLFELLSGFVYCVVNGFSGLLSGTFAFTAG